MLIETPEASTHRADCRSWMSDVGFAKPTSSTGGPRLHGGDQIVRERDARFGGSVTLYSIERVESSATSAEMSRSSPVRSKIVHIGIHLLSLL
jgi:hypothetical protein